MKHLYRFALSMPAAILVAIRAMAQTTDDRWDWHRRMHDGWGDGWGWGHMGAGLIMMLAFWGLVILGIWLAIRWSRSDGNGRADRSRALDILQERFARGEIDRAQYEEMRRTLSQQG